MYQKLLYVYFINLHVDNNTMKTNQLCIHASNEELTNGNFKFYRFVGWSDHSGWEEGRKQLVFPPPEKGLGPEINTR